ncbi:MAG: hypothetical protein P9M14_07570 [Candidatus Alcyoniella australis]|nr:hypothetical protein [Candidatus Alcyoniella australis]
MAPKLGKFKEVTPKQFRCIYAVCPSLFVSDDSFFVVGTVVPPEEIPDNVAIKVGKNESAVLIPKALLTEYFNSKHSEKD